MNRLTTRALSALRTGAAAAVFVFAAGGAAQAAAGAAAAIHAKALVLDSHVDVLLPSSKPRYRTPDGGDFADLAKLRAGGVDAVVYAVAVSTGPRTGADYAKAGAEADEKLAAIRKSVAESGGRAVLVRTPGEVRKAAAEGKTAVLIGFLNAYALGEDETELDRWAREGVVVAGLAHAGNTVFADSSRPRAGEGEEHGGLSAKGRAAVTRLNNLGVLIDVSQLSAKSVLQTLELSRAPVAATHSGVRALVDNPRNLSDAEIDAIAKAGGVIQIPAFNSYLVSEPAGYKAALRALRQHYGLDPDGAGYSGADALPQERQNAFFPAYRGLYPKAGVKELVDQIDYVAKRVGVDHVGVGTDFNHGAGIAGFKDASEAGNVTAELVRRGYSAAQIEKIWGGNFLRVLDAAQKGGVQRRAAR